MHPFVLNYKSTYYTLHFVEDRLVQQEPPNLFEAGRFLLAVVFDFWHWNRSIIRFCGDRTPQLYCSERKILTRDWMIEAVSSALRSPAKNFCTSSFNICVISGYFSGRK